MPNEIQMPIATAQPGVNNFLEGVSRAMREVGVLDTVKQANRNASTTTPTQTALTVAFCSRRPKKNIITAPKAGKSGISQMWLRNSIQFSVFDQSSVWLLARGFWLD